MANQPRILTTTIKDGYPPWGEHTELLPGWKQHVDRTWGRHRQATLPQELLWGWRLFCASKKYDVIITGFERCSQFFAILQRFFRRKPVPHIFLFAAPYLPSHPLKHRVRLLYFRLIFQAAWRVVAYSARQAHLFVRTFNLPPSKFKVIYFYHTLYNAPVTSAQGDYIFAGGDYTRDYKLLIEAVRPLPYSLVIAALHRNYFEGISIPKHVQIVTVSHAEFLKLIAAAGVVVLPLQAGLLHSGGHQTYLNAMRMGKAVVVADELGADEYIQNGVTGVVVAPGDVVVLREVITNLMENREQARIMGEKARVAAGEFTPRRFFDAVLELARTASTTNEL